MKDLTPEHLRCGWGTCPGVYQLPEGEIAIIGKRATPSVRDALAPKIGFDETLIIIDRAYLANVGGEGTG